MLQLEESKPKVLKARTAKLWKVRGKNMPALQAFVLMHPSWFSELIMIDESIIDDAFKELEDIDIMLMEGDN